MFGAERALKRQMIAGDARPSFSTVMIESFNIMQDRLTRMRLAGDPPDVHITPRIGHIGWLDFHRAAESIAVGRAATEKAIELDYGIDRRVELSARPHGDGEICAQVVWHAICCVEQFNWHVVLTLALLVVVARTDRRRARHEAGGLACRGLRIARHHAIRDGRSLRQTDFSGRNGDPGRKFCCGSTTAKTAEQRRRPAA